MKNIREKLVFGLFTVTILGFLLFIFTPLGFASNDQGFSSERERVIKQALDRIELAIEICFVTGGEQSFELFNDYDIDGDLDLVSRLEYPHRGPIFMLKGEVGFLSRFFVGGKYGRSDFRRRDCSDEDWNIFDPLWPNGSDAFVDYQITKQASKSRVEFFDFNVYYRLLDLKEDEGYQGQERLPSEESLFNYLTIESFSLDIFSGYQYHKGRYRMLDPLREFLREDEGTWYYAAGLPDNIGLNSFYKVRYKGPRIGVRAEGSRGKFTSRLRLAYAWLKTKAYGWWNLRELSFWQTGDNGYGIEAGLEVAYALTPSFSAGLGYNYFYCHEGRLELSAVESGVPWPAGAEVRNVNSKIHGPSFILKYTW
ncbi:hypothetical protein ACFL1D_05830 [Candidatus Omnitrophota bacterium]